MAIMTGPFLTKEPPTVATYYSLVDFLKNDDIAAWFSSVLQGLVVCNSAADEPEQRINNCPNSAAESVQYTSSSFLLVLFDMCITWLSVKFATQRLF